MVSASSISTTVRSGAKAVKHGIKRGIKHIKKSADVLIQPLKHAKHALLNVSTPVVSDAEDAAEYQASHWTEELLEVIEVCSDDEGMDQLKKELGMHTHNSFLLSLSLISTLSSSPENLEVPNIVILQE
jgi:hypothetical protein